MKSLYLNINNFFYIFGGRFAITVFFIITIIINNPFIRLFILFKKNLRSK